MQSLQTQLLELDKVLTAEYNVHLSVNMTSQWANFFIECDP